VQDIVPASSAAFKLPSGTADGGGPAVTVAQSVLTTRSAVPVAARVAKESPGAVVRTDLRDTRVYLCSAAVLLRLTDNYDYTVRPARARGWVAGGLV
jgi:hypothetical protein